MVVTGARVEVAFAESVHDDGPTFGPTHRPDIGCRRPEVFVVVESNEPVAELVPHGVAVVEHHRLGV